MKDKILALLKSSSDYISGQNICNQLGVSRTAVWKNINALKQEGYEIDSVNNKGYRLLSEPDIINEMRIREYMNTKWMGKDIIYFPVTDSTNTQAKRLGEEGAEHGTLVVTQCQTAGRGRRGRSWESPEGNVYFTFILRPEVEVSRASMLTLVSALALAKAIERVTKLDTRIKWPNDVVANGKKLCGILTESSTDLEYINYVVVGIGINVNQTYFPDELADKASSLLLELGHSVNRGQILGEFLNQFEKYYEIFMKTENMSDLVALYNEKLVNCGREVKIIEKDNERILKAIGIDNMGGLIVENPEGVRETIISGEVSVRGIYGYV
ncbi:MAG: biotin--[acetyl-CoA-carboxylase] ligase [Lachnospiraceae bacterium]